MSRCIPVDGDSRLPECRHALLQQSQPLAGNRRLEILKPGDVAIGVREAVDKSAPDRVRDLDENGRYGLVQLFQGGEGGVATDHKYIRRSVGERDCFRPDLVDLIARPSDLYADVATVAPTELAERVDERCNARAAFWIGLSIARRQHAHTPGSIGLLRAHHEWPRERTADNSHKVPTPHVRLQHRPTSGA